MSNLGESLEELAKAISGLYDYSDPNVHIESPKIGTVVGRCKNCGSDVEIRQPWMSKIQTVNDGWYLFHCTNEDCHNYYGMEVMLSELGLLEFLEWDEKYIVEKTESVEPQNVVNFVDRKNQL